MNLNLLSTAELERMLDRHLYFQTGGSAERKKIENELCARSSDRPGTDNATPMLFTLSETREKR